MCLEHSKWLKMDIKWLIKLDKSKNNEKHNVESGAGHPWYHKMFSSSHEVVFVFVLICAKQETETGFQINYSTLTLSD